MNPGPDDALQPELNRAKKQLADALDEACGVDVERADTGELIRVEEVLAIANEAAKTAVTIRRRRSQRKRAHSRVDVQPPTGHRAFLDAAGVQWDAFAVYPTQKGEDQSQLPEPYRHGWLAFDSDAEKRRLTPVPNGWESLPEQELRALCERAEVVRGYGR